MANVVPESDVVERLAALYRRNGYVRRVDLKRRRAESRKYKKGDEVRLVAESANELRTIRRLLRAAGFDPARPHVKAKQWRQPVYGRAEVERFLVLIGEIPSELAKRPSQELTLTP